MRDLLQHAGAPKEVLPLVDEVVDTCRICRNWTRPGPKSIASSRLSTRFNEAVQVDLLFHQRHIILHMNDECTTWTAATEVNSQDQNLILEAMKNILLKLHGYPGLLTSDQEGGIKDQDTAAHLEESAASIAYFQKQYYQRTACFLLAIDHLTKHSMDERFLCWVYWRRRPPQSKMTAPKQD